MISELSQVRREKKWTEMLSYGTYYAGYFHLCWIMCSLGSVSMRIELHGFLQETPNNSGLNRIEGLPRQLAVKNLSANAGDIRDAVSIPGSGRPPGGS